MKQKDNSYIYKDNELRQLQLKGLEIFLYIKKFCEENGLLIYFCGGCCIGTIRNKGFIPWDDDIDAFMPREDYEKLKVLWEEKADTDRYTCEFPSEDTYVRNLFINIRDNNTTFIKSIQQDLDINHGVVVDIFPLDGCPTRKMQRLMQKFWTLVYSLYCAQMAPENHGKFISILGAVMLKLVPSKRLRYKIWKFAEKNMTKYKIKDCNYITELCSGPKYMNNEYPKELFEKAIYKDFEGYKMPIPVGYDKYLKMAYGNYMELPPIEKQKPEHSIVMLDLNNCYKKYKGIYYCNK